MKRIFFLAALMFAASFSSFAQIQSAQLVASGLTCSMCSKSITKALQALPAVAGVDANIQTSIYTITFKPGTTATPDELKGAVEKAGFSVADLKVIANFPQSVTLTKDAHITYGGATYHFLTGEGQTVSGTKTFRVVDKNFLPEKEHRRFAKMTTMSCVKTGRMENCCHKGNGDAGDRVYHVTLL